MLSVCRVLLEALDQMIDCNQELLAMFGAKRAQIIGRSFEILHPIANKFELIGVRWQRC